jgi:hypothetical protein
MRRILRLFVLAIILLLAGWVVGCQNIKEKTAVPPSPEPGEELSGGQGTIFDTTPNAFSLPLPGLERD